MKAVPDKLFGVITMFAAIAFLFALPWFDRGNVRSWRYRCGFHKVNLLVFAAVFVFFRLSRRHSTRKLENYSVTVRNIYVFRILRAAGYLQ